MGRTLADGATAAEGVEDPVADGTTDAEGAGRLFFFFTETAGLGVTFGAPEIAGRDGGE